MKNRGLIIIGTAVLLTLFITWLRGYTGILLFTGDIAEAQVLKYELSQGSHDWILDYQFQSVGGQMYVGTARFPEKVRPPDDIQKVTIKFLPMFPDVSGVVGYISPTGVSGYLFSLFIFFRGIVFLRRDKSKSA